MAQRDLIYEIFIMKQEEINSNLLNDFIFKHFFKIEVMQFIQEEGKNIQLSQELYFINRSFRCLNVIEESLISVINYQKPLLAHRK